MKTAIVTGAFGFAGANLVEHLLDKGYKVYAVGRMDSLHNDRFIKSGYASERLVTVFVDMDGYDRLPEQIPQDEKVDCFFHLAWGGARDDFDAQMKNVNGALKAMDAAIALASGNDANQEQSGSPSIPLRFLGIGSQAEYGIKSDAELITEDMALQPFTSYGSCKAAAFYLMKRKAELAGLDFMWGRIFSLIGKYEPAGRMLPDLVDKLKKRQPAKLSSCEQYWDYLDAGDAAEAMIAICEKGKSGSIYNIANGDFRPLKDYVLEAARILGTDEGLISFGSKAEPFVSLRPSVLQLREDTGWQPKASFSDSISEYQQEC